MAAAAMTHPGWEDVIASGKPDAPHLLFDWRPGAPADALDAEVTRLGAVVTGSVTGGLCAHPAERPCAGAGPHFRDCSSHLRGSTMSTLTGPRSSVRARRTARSRPRSVLSIEPGNDDPYGCDGAGGAPSISNMRSSR